MQMITPIQIELYGDTKHYLVSAKQGDRATRFIQVELMAYGLQFEIPTDAVVYANIRKPDKKFCYNECVVENNRVMVELTNQALAAAGTAYCDIEIRRAEDFEILSSASFTIEIEESMRDESAILSCNEITAIDKKVQRYIDEILNTKPYTSIRIFNENATQPSEQWTEVTAEEMGGTLNIFPGENVSVDIDTEGLTISTTGGESITTAELDEILV